MKAWAQHFAGAALLIVLGMAIGTWATTHHFRPLLDDQQDLATQCTAARDNLAALVHEQGRAVGDMALAANERKVRAALTMKDARVSAQIDYAAANLLQQGRTEGDMCAAATSILDEELGL